MPLFIPINVVNAAIFPVQQRYRRYFSSSTPLTPLFSGLPLLMPLFFRFNAVNANFVSCSTLLRPLFVRFSAVNAAISPIQHRQCRYFSSSTSLTPLFPVQGLWCRHFSGSAPLTSLFFPLNAAVFPVKGRIFSGSTPLTSLCFRYNFVIAAIHPDQRR